MAAISNGSTPSTQDESERALRPTRVYLAKMVQIAEGEWDLFPARLHSICRYPRSGHARCFDSSRSRSFCIAFSTRFAAPLLSLRLSLTLTPDFDALSITSAFSKAEASTNYSPCDVA